MDVKIADRLNEAAVEPYLFLGFTQRGAAGLESTASILPPGKEISQREPKDEGCAA